MSSTTSSDDQRPGIINETVGDAKQDAGQYQVQNTGDPELAERRADQDDEQFIKDSAEGGAEGLGGVAKKANDAAASVSMGF